MHEPTIRRAGEPDTLTVEGLVAAPTTVDRSSAALGQVLERAAPGDAADHATVHSGDGLFTASIPLARLATASLAADGRLQIDDTPTRCWLVKDVRRIVVTAGRQPDSLPPEERAKT